MVLRKQLQTGKLYYLVYSSVNARGVFSACCGKVSCTAATAFNQLCGFTDKCAGIEIAAFNEVFAYYDSDERFVVKLAAKYT